jgi:hypothetical protein
MSYEFRAAVTHELRKVAEEYTATLVNGSQDTIQQLAFRQGYIQATQAAIELVQQVHRQLTGDSDG